MDFAAGLKKLQQTAASNNNNSGSSSNNQQYRRRHDDHRRNRSRSPPRHHRSPHHHHHSSSSKKPRRARWHENSMRRALQSISLYRPFHQPQETEATCHHPKPFHLCFLIITISDLPYEHIWKAWAADAAANNNNNQVVSFICHAKYPDRVQSEWLKKRLLVKPPRMGRGTGYAPPVYHTRRPDWGSIEITRAMIDLLHEGLEIGPRDNNNRNEYEDFRFSPNRYVIRNDDHNDQEKARTKEDDDAIPPADKFIFVSETCLPVAPLSTFFDTLGTESISTSWVAARNTPNNGYSLQLQFERIHSVIPTHHRWKADQWMVLCRRHVQFIFDIDRRLPTALWECFIDCKASDELYFPTALSLAGILRQQASEQQKATATTATATTTTTTSSSDEIQRRRITYADWSESAKNPASFIYGKKDLIAVAAKAREEGCLIARKFVLSAPGSTNEKTGEISVEEWKEVVMPTTLVTEEEKRQE